MVKLLNLWFKWLGCVDSGWPGLILNFPINQFLVDGWLLPYIIPPYSITINIKPTWISTHRLMTHAIWRWWECARKCFVGRAHFDSDSGFAWQKRFDAQWPFSLTFEHPLILRNLVDMYVAKVAGILWFACFGMSIGGGTQLLSCSHLYLVEHTTILLIFQVIG